MNPHYLTTQILWFMAMLWCSGDIVEIRALPAVHGHGRPVRHWLAAERLVDAAGWMGDLNLNGFNIYVGVLPRSHHGGGKASDTLPGHAVWIDIDNTTTDAVLRAFYDDKSPHPLFAPSMVVNSGNGVHAFWRLSEPLAPTEIVALNRTIVKYARDTMGLSGADPTATDAARILRLPGTVNFKGGHLCYIVAALPEVQYAPAAFTTWARAVTPVNTPVAVEAPRPAIRVEPGRVGTGGVFDIRRAQRYVAAVPGASSGSRNATAYRLACVCQFGFGLTPADTETLLNGWARRCTPSLFATDGPAVVRGIVHNAKKYGGRKRVASV